MITMLEDKRPIRRAWSIGEQDPIGASVGFKDVVRMEIYGEVGESCLVPWIAVYKTDANGNEYIWTRLNASQMASVEYYE